MSDSPAIQQQACTLISSQHQAQPSQLEGSSVAPEDANQAAANRDNNVLVVTINSPVVAEPGPAPSPVRVPGTFPPEWLPDHDADACMACASPFTLIKRRHHCRSCGKIFCGDCCKQKARLLYMDNREARVCNNCHQLVEYTLTIAGFNGPRDGSDETSEASRQSQQQVPAAAAGNNWPSSSHTPTTSSNCIHATRPSTSATLKVQGVLKTANQASRLTGAAPNDLCNISNSSSSDHPSSKQVIFSDGIRPGTDLSEPFPYQTSPTSSTDNSTNAPFSLPSRQNRVIDTNPGSSASNTTTAVVTTTSATQSPSSSTENHKRVRSSKSVRNITVCDELGYLPPIVISKESLISSSSQADEENTSSSSLASLIISQFKTSKKTLQASMESRSCPLNGIVKFEEISDLVGVNNVITFLLLKSFYLKVKIVRKVCCVDRKWSCSSDSEKHNEQNVLNLSDEINAEAQREQGQCQTPPEYWCFTSSGLDKLGQDEIVFVLDKDKNNSCIPRDIFKIYLTLHELALRRQAIENLGNLLFQDGLFGNRDTAGLLFVQPLEDHCLQNLVLPDNKFLIALVLQRWEVPWSKVFPMRLLLRLGHKYDVYPYPIVGHRIRDPVYYEIGHTIISILGDFRNFRYSLTHVDGLKVMLDKASKKVTVQLHQSNYMQFSKVLDSSNNEHVLAWSASPFPEADGHLISVQNDEGQYETVEFYKRSHEHSISFRNLETGPILGASFIVFSGALKPNQSGQPAKISIVEDGLLIQIQSCTMAALRNAIHYMENFDIDCENSQDSLNRVEIRWQAKEL